MLTSKQRSDLRSEANTLETTLMVGKEGVTDSVIAEAARQLEARELIKGRVLENALLSSREACDALCEALKADGVQCIGSKFVLYKKSEKKAQVGKFIAVFPRHLVDQGMFAVDHLVVRQRKNEVFGISV